MEIFTRTIKQILITTGTHSVIQDYQEQRKEED